MCKRMGLQGQVEGQGQLTSVSPNIVQHMSKLGTHHYMVRKVIAG